MSAIKKEQPYLPLSTSPTLTTESIPSTKTKSVLKTTIILISFLTLLAPLFHFSPQLKRLRNCHGSSSSHMSSSSVAQCPIQFPALNIGGISFNPKDDVEYKLNAVERFKGAIRIPTVSYDDMGLPSEDPRFHNLIKLHEYLKAQFPLLHEHLGLELVATYGLLFTWKGTKEGLKPVVLMAHQDVVPVNPATEDRWTYPPFSAHQDEAGWIWGRGGADCKNTLIGIMASIEQLLSESYIPERTIILSFGFDEEIGGSRSAQPLANTLHSKYGTNGVAMIVDEGFTGIDEAYGQTFASLGMAEKGAFSLTLEILTDGGHSSVPATYTSITALSLLLVELEKNKDQVRLREGNPVLSYLNCAADFGNMDKDLKRKVKNPKKWLALGEEMSKGNDVTRAFLATTQAVDLISGGVKINALPEQAIASINYRIDFLSSTTETFNRISNLLAPVVESLNMTFSIKGSHKDIINKVVRLDIVQGSMIEPAPLTSSAGPSWELMSGTVKHIFPGAIVAPSGMIANTDTKWSWEVSENIYRFAPAELSLFKDFHTVDERIHEDAHFTTIQFFYTLIRNTEGWNAD